VVNSIRQDLIRLFSFRWTLPVLLALVVITSFAFSAYSAFGHRPPDWNSAYIAAYGFSHQQPVYVVTAQGGWEELRSGLAAQLGVVPEGGSWRYPPLQSVLMMPFLSFDMWTACLLWNILGCIAVIIAGFLLAAAFDNESTSIVTNRCITIIVIFFFIPLYNTLWEGQFNLLPLLSVAFAFYFLHRKREVYAGMALGVGIAIKLFPAALIVWLLWRRRFKAFFMALLVGLTLTLLSGFFIGWTNLGWYLQHGLGLANEGWAIQPPNQSLFAFFTRIFTVHPWGPALVTKPELVGPLTWTMRIVLLGGVAVLCWPRRSSFELLALECSLVLITLFLIAPTAWEHHLVMLYVPFVVLGTRALNGKLSIPACILTLGAFVLIDMQGLLWHKLVGYTLLSSLGTYAMLILWAIFAWLIHFEKWPVLSRHAAKAAGSQI
jgi:hypothetical protein